MNSLGLTFVIVSVLIGIVHCSVLIRREDQNEIDTSAMLRDSFGCDAAVKSCGKNGKCCDMHDTCYKKHHCTAHSWFYLCKSKFIFYIFIFIHILGGDCHQCNVNVMACIVALNPGKSSCCANKNCGKPR